MKKRFLIFLVVIFVINSVHSQDRKSIKALFTEEAFEIDGKLLEPQWQKAPPQSNFVQNFPTDTLPASQDTEFRILYNNDFLYVGLVMQTQSNEFVPIHYSAITEQPEAIISAFLSTPITTVQTLFYLVSIPLE